MKNVDLTALPYPTTAPYDAAAIGRRRQNVPDRIERVFVPLSVLQATSDVMRAIGHEEREAYVWWGGYFTPSDFAQVTTAYVPGIHTAYGRVAFSTGEYHLLHKELRSRDQALVAELHTHPPGAGGQNEVDAAHAAAPYPGFISIVVPSFAFPHFHDPRQTYVYEYVADNDWKELSPEEIQAKIVIEDTLITVESK
jgi:hypothetical protein